MGSNLDRKILILVSLIYLSGCSLASFEKGLNYEKKTGYGSVAEGILESV
jgi:hypothetical protein